MYISEVQKTSLFWSGVDTSRNSKHEHKRSNSNDVIGFFANISPDYKKMGKRVLCSVLKGCYYGLFYVDGKQGDVENAM